MARWFTIGCESTPTNGEGVFFRFEGEYTAGANATVTKSTSVKRTGAASRAHNAGVSDALVYTQLFWGLQGANGYYTRIYFRVSALPAGTVRILYHADNTTPLTGARLTAAGKIQLWNEVSGSEAQIGSDSAATVAADTWYRLELFTKVVAGASDQTELRLDGTSVASASGQAYSESQVTNVNYGWLNSPGASKVFYVDDVAVNDDTGAALNTWPGAGQIVYLLPLSDNARTGSWTTGSGATTSLFEAVNNDPPVGTTLPLNQTQIVDASTTDTTGNYDANMQSYSAAGIVAGSTVTVAQSVFQVGTNNTVTVSGAMRIVSNPAQASEDSKTIGNSAALGVWPSNWHTIWGTAQATPAPTLGTQPVLRIGRRGTQLTELHCCGMRIAVEYTPGGGGGGTTNMTLMGVG